MLERERELERRLPSELHEARHLAARRRFGLDHRHHIFERQRLKVQPVGGVVVGRDRFRIAVDHHRLETLFAEREGRVTAAIIELDALADPVRTAAEDHDLVPAVWIRLAGRLVRAVEIRRVRFELGRARVHTFVNRLQTLRRAALPDRLLLNAGGQCQLGVAKACPLQPAHAWRIEDVNPASRQLVPHLADLGKLAQEPWVDPRDLVNLLNRPAAVERAEQVPHPPIGRHGEPFSERRIVFARLVGAGEEQAASPELERADALHERFLERPADGHRLADRLHLRRQRPIRLRKLLEVPPRDLDDDVVDGRLEGRRRHTCDVVRDLVEVIAEGELRSDLRNRKAGRLGGKRGRSRDARVHLDDDHSPVRRVHGELDVRPPGFDADSSDDPPRGVAHPLIFLVAQREDRRDRDAVARMDAHRVDVLDRADDDEIVGDVAHHLELELFPADHRLFDEHLVNGAQLEAALGEIAELFDVVRDAAADAAKRKGRADHEREAKRPREIDPFRQAARQPALRHVEADRPHRVLEQLAILGHLDGFDRGADQLDVVLIERARVGKVHGQVERGLAADGRQHGVGPLALDDRRHEIGGQRLDVGAIGELRVGHDRRRITVDEDHFQAFGAERLARLRSGVVEFARLADHDRSGANHQNAFDVGALWHRQASGSRLQASTISREHFPDPVARSPRPASAVGTLNVFSRSSR